MMTLKNFNPSFKATTVKSNSIHRRKFSVTPRRYAMEAGPLILAKYGTMSPAFTLAMVFITYGISVGGYLVTRLARSASEAQHIEMFPDELEDDFFFVPDHVMGRMYRFLGAMRQGVNHWNNTTNLLEMSQENGRRLLDELQNLRPLLADIRQECTYISDLSNPAVNGHIEFVVRDLHELRQILDGIDSIIYILSSIV